MKKIKVGIIPAAGIGRRMSSLPLTRILPKPLLPILNKPIIEYGIENIKQIGVEDLYIVVGFKKELIKEYFGDGTDFGVNIEYIVQPIPSGIAAAVELTRNCVDEPFAIILGDDLTIAKSLDNLVNDFWKKGAKILEGVVYEKDIEKIKMSCSVTLGEQGEMLNIVEKPTTITSHLRGCGFYICDPVVYDFIAHTSPSPPRGEREFSNTIKLMSKKHVAYGSFINGININVNQISDLIEAALTLLGKERTNSI